MLVFFTMTICYLSCDIISKFSNTHNKVYLKRLLGASMLAQLADVLVSKCGELCVVSWSHMVEGENWLFQVVSDLHKHVRMFVYLYMCS